MQKISSYLYPNKINIVADLAVFPVRWNIVYQNRVKIYQGVDNLLTLDVKNADQKRIDIDGMQLKMSIMSSEGEEVATIPISTTDTKGLATVNVTAAQLASVTPQFLKFTIYRINEDQSKTVFYADTQFGVDGKMELVGSAVPVRSPARLISRFNALSRDGINRLETTYYSDAVEITRPNIIKNPLDEALNFEFLTHNLEAEVVLEFTKDKIVSAGTDWEIIETFDISPSTVTTIKTYMYPIYTREYTWARVKYKKQNESTGKIVKVIVTFDEVEEFFINNGEPDSVITSGIDGGSPGDEIIRTIDAGEQ
jgi:hypothetical protein